MKRPGCAALTAALCGISIGCASGGGSSASISQTTPAAAYSDAPFSLAIYGLGFRPAYRIDTMSGSAGLDTGGFTAFLAPPPSAGLPRVEATGLAWQSEGLLVAQFPAGIAAGTYDVGVHDPRGQDAIRSLAFLSLGKDTKRPTISLQQPATGTLVGAGSDVKGLFYADDGVGTVASLGWTASTAEQTISGSCPTSGASGKVICRFEFTAPSPPTALEALFLDAFAFDQAGNEGTAQTALAIAPRPAVISVAPRIGPTAGGTTIDVEGTNFLAPAAADPGTQILIDGQAITTTFVSTTTLSGFTPAHDSGDWQLSVTTGNAGTPAGSFTFVAPAVVRLVSPTTGSPSGGTPVVVVGDNFRDGGTEISFGGYALVCPRFVSPNRIEGWTPPGVGAVDVTATDQIAGGNALEYGFTYLDGADGGQPPGPGCGGTGGGP